MENKKNLTDSNLRVANLTIIDPVNIGNRLQNYAVQELLRSKGCIVDTLYYRISDNNTKSKVLSYVIGMLRKCGIYGSKVFVKHVKHDKKMRLTKEFNDKYLSLKNKYIFDIPKPSKMAKHINEYDYYCVGSDQIWNAMIVQNNGFLFLDFAPSVKTFSIAASMGTTYIPDDYKETYVNGFTHIENISVREEDVKVLINELTGREAVVLLDPTLLISKDRWVNVIKKPNFDIRKKYIATYFLGPLTASQEYFINEYAKINDYEIIDMNGKYKKDIGPSEFVYIISNAEFIFTDSFHGTAFSIIFNKNFVVFQRNKSFDMSSRMTTLLKKLDLMEHFYNIENNKLPDDFLDYIEMISNRNYNVEFVLNNEKKKSDEFLNKCLGLGGKW